MKYIKIITEWKTQDSNDEEMKARSVECYPMEEVECWFSHDDEKTWTVSFKNGRGDQDGATTLEFIDSEVYKTNERSLDRLLDRTTIRSKPVFNSQSMPSYC